MESGCPEQPYRAVPVCGVVWRIVAFVFYLIEREMTFRKSFFDAAAVWDILFPSCLPRQLCGRRSRRRPNSSIRHLAGTVYNVRGLN